MKKGYLFIAGVTVLLILLSTNSDTVLELFMLGLFTMLISYKIDTQNDEIKMLERELFRGQIKSKVKSDPIEKPKEPVVVIDKNLDMEAGGPNEAKA